MSDPIREAAEEVLEAWSRDSLSVLEYNLEDLQRALYKNPPKGVCTGCKHYALKSGYISDGWCDRIGLWFWHTGINPETHYCAEWEAKGEE